MHRDRGKKEEEKRRKKEKRRFIRSRAVGGEYAMKCRTVDRASGTVAGYQNKECRAV